MLGLVVDLTESHLGIMSICHTAERGSELTSAVDKVLTDKLLSVKDAERLRGRMIFFEGLTYGRTANTAIKEVLAVFVLETERSPVMRQLRISNF